MSMNGTGARHLNKSATTMLAKQGSENFEIEKASKLESIATISMYQGCCIAHQLTQTWQNSTGFLLTVVLDPAPTISRLHRKALRCISSHLITARI